MLFKFNIQVKKVGLLYCIARVSSLSHAPLPFLFFIQNMPHCQIPLFSPLLKYIKTMQIFFSKYQKTCDMWQKIAESANGIDLHRNTNVAWMWKKTPILL